MTKTPYPPWSPDPGTLDAWSALVPSQRVTLAKLDPSGQEVARYDGAVVATREPEGWVEIEARWTNRSIDVHGLRFAQGDLLRERFSPAVPFNVFAVHGPGGELRGWYANVTYPTRLTLAGPTPHLLWHDLYLDLIGFPDGSFLIADEDELAASNLDTTQPDLHASIITAGDELVWRFQHHQYPF